MNLNYNKKPFNKILLNNISTKYNYFYIDLKYLVIYIKIKKLEKILKKKFEKRRKFV